MSLKIHDALGRTIATLLEGKIHEEGKHKINFNAEKLPEGIYFYTITIGNKQQTFKLVKTH